MPGDWPLSTNLPTQESGDVSSSPGPGVDGGFGHAASKAKPSLPQQPDSISAPQIPPDPVFQSLFFISISCKKLPQLPWFLREILPSSSCPTFPGSVAAAPSLCPHLLLVVCPSPAVRLPCTQSSSNLGSGLLAFSSHATTQACSRPVLFL